MGAQARRVSAREGRPPCLGERRRVARWHCAEWGYIHGERPRVKRGQAAGNAAAKPQGPKSAGISRTYWSGGMGTGSVGAWAAGALGVAGAAGAAA